MPTDDRVIDAIEELPAKYRQVLLLSDLDGVPLAEIARVLKVPLGCFGRGAGAGEAATAGGGSGVSSMTNPKRPRVPPRAVGSPDVFGLARRPWGGARSGGGTLTKLRQTRASNSAPAIRILLGLLFLSTGAMKFAVPDLRAAFSGQLTAAGIPFPSLNMWVIPAAEIGVGVLFLLGFLLRPASLFAIVMMVVATYVHLVGDDPVLFPLQPEQPIIPTIAVALCFYLLWIESQLIEGNPGGDNAG